MSPVRWKKESSVCVVMASKGYPGKYKSGQEIKGLNSFFSKNVIIFHAGTRRDSTGRLVTAGGRVLGVTARGQDLDTARKEAYNVVRSIWWGPGEEYYRTDIGKSLSSGN
jgi:phosphoribosylamine--glycine ligase